MVAKAVGVILAVYGLACIVFNFLGIVLTVIPNLGVVGSWLFNPVGMLFSGYVVGNLTGALPFGLGAAELAWAVGGLIAIVWSVGLTVFGVFLAK